MDNQIHNIGHWDLLIAHPPCTYLSCVSNRSLSLRCNSPEKVIERMWELAKAAVFFMQFALADIPHICIENPTGYMSKLWRKPDQIVHPYYFATSTKEVSYEKKRTCFWLKNLPPLERTVYLPKPKPKGYSPSGKALGFTEMVTKDRARVRSKTFPSIAKAMADQWGKEDNDC